MLAGIWEWARKPAKCWACLPCMFDVGTSYARFNCVFHYVVGKLSLVICLLVVVFLICITFNRIFLHCKFVVFHCFESSFHSPFHVSLGATKLRDRNLDFRHASLPHTFFTCRGILIWSLIAMIALSIYFLKVFHLFHSFVYHGFPTSFHVFK